MPTMILKNGPTGHLWEPHDRWNNTSKLWPIRIPIAGDLILRDPYYAILRKGHSSRFDSK